MSPSLKRPTAALTALLWFAVLPAVAQLAPIPQDEGASGLALALRRLPVTGRVLYVTAHPDDENNAVLVALSRGRGLDTALLTLTRGEGGQNAIGTEMFEALGVLRTEELLAVHRYDGARQFFSRAYEFGFSFSLDETLAKWGHDETLGDVVRVVRAFRPDVILTLPLDAPDHQHHVAAARLAVEAFRAAANPERFPEQGLRPWQARKVYQGGVGGDNTLPPGVAPLVLKTGEYDPVLGMSWSEFGSLARASHRCQASNQLRIAPGDYAEARYVLADAEPKSAEPETDVMDGVDVSLRGLLRFGPVDAVRLRALEEAVAATAAAFDPRAPEKTLPALAKGLAAVRELEAEASPELLLRLQAKESDFLVALALAQGLFVNVAASDGAVVAGETFATTVRVWNRGVEPLRLDDVALRVPEGWAVKLLGGEGGSLAPNHGLVFKYEVSVGANARVSQPYWHRVPRRDRYDADPGADPSLPWSPPEVVATVRYSVRDVPASLERPALFRYEARLSGGEKQKVVNVVPAFSVRVAPEIAVFPVRAVAPVTREVRVAVSNQTSGEASASVRLLVPMGWNVTPRELLLRFRSEGEEIAARFSVAAPPLLKEGEARIDAIVTAGVREFREGLQTIAYDHVQERQLLRPASTRALLLDVRTAPGISVGYVMGVGDEVPEAIRQLGVPVSLLSADDLAYADLATYTTVVLGVRAYQARKDLRSYQDRLMRYVEAGGNLLVQYNRWEFNPLPAAPSPYAPYPARVTTNRITDETAPVEVLAPANPVFSSPNRIAPRDWDGWVQERAIQLLEAKDARYTDLLQAADPFPKNAGAKKGLLVEARVGKGTWTYLGLGLFRQLPAGTPGAYRLLANLISRPRGR